MKGQGQKWSCLFVPFNSKSIPKLLGKSFSRLKRIERMKKFPQETEDFFLNSCFGYISHEKRFQAERRKGICPVRLSKGTDPWLETIA